MNIKLRYKTKLQKQEDATNKEYRKKLIITEKWADDPKMILVNTDYIIRD